MRPRPRPTSHLFWDYLDEYGQACNLWDNADMDEQWGGSRMTDDELRAQLDADAARPRDVDAWWDAMRAAWETQDGDNEE